MTPRKQNGPEPDEIADEAASLAAGSGFETASETRIDSAMYLLSHRRRRDALRFLRDADGPVRPSTLVDHVVDRALAGSPDLSAERVEDAVRRDHLPKLEHSAVVERLGSRLRYVSDPTIERLLMAVTTIEEADGR